MSEWKEYTLGEIASEIGDGLHGTPEYSDEGEYYFVNGNNIQNGKITIKNDTKKVGIEEFEQYKKPLSNRTLLLSINGTIGNVGKYNSERCILGKSACYINLKDSFDKNFVYYMLRSNDFQIHLKNIATGTTILNVPLKGLRESRIILPSLDEQQRIAGVLSSLDDKIDLLNRENATLEALAETLFRHYFIENPNPEWKESPLSTIATFLNGLACQKYPPKDLINRLPVLKIKELSSGITKDSDWATTDVGEEYIVHCGDVIFAWSASLMVKMWNGEDCVLNQHLFKVTSDIFPRWYYYLWCKYHLQEFISIAQSHATTMGHIKRGDLDSAMVLVPSRNEMESFTKQIEPLLKRVETNYSQINNLSFYRDNLLLRLMSGEVKVGE